MEYMDEQDFNSRDDVSHVTDHIATIGYNMNNIKKHFNT